MPAFLPDSAPTLTATFDFSCDNLSLAASTLYQLEFYESTGTLQLIMNYYQFNAYAGGNLITDGTNEPTKDLKGWQVNLINGDISIATGTATKTINGCTGFFDGSSRLITSVFPGSTNGIVGSTTAKVWIESTQPTQFVKRHYEITPATNVATATGRVTLYFTQQEFTDFNAVNTVKLPTGSADAAGKANLLIEKRPGTSSNSTGLPGTYTGTPVTINPVDADIVWNSTANRWEVSFNVTGFSGFFVKTVSGILPLNWLNVSGSLNNQKQAVLNFKVQENNVASYQIEKSSNGNNFTGIATISSNGDGENTYQFTDAAVLNGTTFYRIKQIDKDGSYSYSSIIRLSDAANRVMSVYPNPVKDMVSISGATIGTKAVLTDLSGKVLQQINITQSSFTVDMSKYSSGIYILKTDGGVMQKIIKE